MKRRILYIQYTAPAAYPPLEHSSQVLAHDGWDVLFLGIRKPNDPPLDWPKQDRIFVRELPPGRDGWRRKLHYLRFAWLVVSWFVRWRPDWVYVSDALACPVGLVLSLWPGVKIVYHEHDAPQVQAQGIVRRLVLSMRAGLARRASARVLPNARRAEQFSRQVANHRPTFSVWNCPSRDEVGPTRSRYEVRRLQLLYVGSIVPFRLPIAVLQAMTLLPDEVRLRVIGYETSGHSGYVAQLRRVARELGIADRTEFLPGMPHAKLLAECQEADVGLVLMPDQSADVDSQWMPGASNKPFDYLAGGVALLVTDDPGWRELIVDPGYGLACHARDPRSVAGAVRCFLERPAETRAMGERGRRRVLAEWNYETQFAPVRDWINANCDSRPRTI